MQSGVIVGDLAAPIDHGHFGRSAQFLGGVSLLSCRGEKKDNTRRDPRMYPTGDVKTHEEKRTAHGTTKKVPILRTRRLFIAFEMRDKGEIKYKGATTCPGIQTST